MRSSDENIVHVVRPHCSVITDPLISYTACQTAPER